MTRSWILLPFGWHWSRLLALVGIVGLAFSLAACGEVTQASVQTASDALLTSNTPSAAMSTTADAATPNASPTTGAISGAIAAGAAGSDAWAITSSQFLSTTDTGIHWSNTLLPVSSATAPAFAAAVSPSGALWLMNAFGNTASFYQAASPASKWIKTSIDLTWPTGAPGPPLVSQSTRAAELGASAPGILAAAVTEGGGKTGLVGLVILSTDGGKTFQLCDPPALYGDWYPAFTSATNGVVVGNSVIIDGESEPGAIYSTTDGGASWERVTLPGYVQPSASSSAAPSLLGTPLVEGSRIYLTANVPTSLGRSLILYVSEDGGRTFEQQGAVSESNSNDNAPPLIGVNGTSVWMASTPPAGRTSIYTSSDSGTTWKTVTTMIKNPFATSGIGLQSSNVADIWIASSSCASFHCSTSATLLSTTDGGQQWHQVAAPMYP